MLSKAAAAGILSAVMNPIPNADPCTAPYRIDTHVHTAEVSPCARLGAVKLVQLYRDAGYNGIIVTDHFYSGSPAFADRSGTGSGPSWSEKIARYRAGYLAAREAGARERLDVFFGMEVSLDLVPGNDFLVLGVDEPFLLGHPDLLSWPLERLSAELRAAGALLVQAHPFRHYCTAQSARLLDGVEVVNGNPGHDSRNALAAGYARDHRLFETAGSDTHREEEVGNAGLLLPRRPDSIADVISMIREREATVFAAAGVR